VSRDIAAVLGANQKKDGYFEGNGYQVTYTFGHLVTIVEPEEMNPAWGSTLDDGATPNDPDPMALKRIQERRRKWHI
jgi:DNA topoisomerase III